MPVFVGSLVELLGRKVLERLNEVLIGNRKKLDVQEKRRQAFRRIVTVVEVIEIMQQDFEDLWFIFRQRDAVLVSFLLWCKSMRSGEGL